MCTDMHSTRSRLAGRYVTLTRLKDHTTIPGLSARIPSSLLRLLAAVTLAVTLVACSESTVVPPVAPSPLNPDRIGELAIACPADIQVQSPDGQPTPIAFQLANPEGGEAPVTAGCIPESGSSFPIARNRITCTASDKLGQSASCTFDAVVLPPPTLQVTTIMAFGDSLTEGEVALPISETIRLAVEVHNAYPTKLQARLRQAYQVQSATVINEGQSGERADWAPPRLQAALSRHRPDVVLLMEGTNDLNSPDATELSYDVLALDGIEEMLDRIAAAGADAILATIPPIRSSADSESVALVGPYNAALRSIALSRGVPLVDVHAVLSSGNCQGMSCIGVDNLHPTVEGYELIAAAFFERIVELYDIPVVVPTVTETGTTTWRD